MKKPLWLTHVNKIKYSYFKPSFGLEIYITICFQYIIILLIIFNLHIWIHVIYTHKILLMDHKSIMYIKCFYISHIKYEV